MQLQRFSETSQVGSQAKNGGGASAESTLARPGEPETDYLDSRTRTE
jgi:hypothetical protein